MDDGSRLPIIIAVLLLFGAGYFAVSETAFASCSKTRLRASAERGDRRAESALFVLDHFDRMITTVLIGTNLCHLFLSALVTVSVTRRWGLAAVGISTILTTIIVFMLAEMLPKSLAKKRPESFAKLNADSLRLCMILFSPLSQTLSKLGESFAMHSKGEPELSVTEDELYDIIEDMTEEGSLDEEQGELISSALQFNDLSVESVLTPRVDIIALNADTSPENVLSLIKNINHSRLPVYEGSIDHIIGILPIRKYIKANLRLPEPPSLREMLDEPLFVHQSTELNALLQMLSHRRMSMAIVTDNFGGTLGLVTVEDIVEEIVGEIWDEDDVIEESVTDLSENACIVDADELVSDLFEHLDYEDPEDNEDLIDTRVAEWAYQNFETIPRTGDSFRYHDLLVTVTAMERNRILQLEVVKQEGGKTE